MVNYPFLPQLSMWASVIQVVLILDLFKLCFWTSVILILAWGVALIWITLSCCWGYATPVNKILSYQAFFPLSRLSYCAYLLHPVVMMVTSFQMESPMHLQHVIVVSRLVSTNKTCIFEWFIWFQMWVNVYTLYPVASSGSGAPGTDMLVCTLLSYPLWLLFRYKGTQKKIIAFFVLQN